MRERERERERERGDRNLGRRGKGVWREGFCFWGKECEVIGIVGCFLGAHV